MFRLLYVLWLISFLFSFQSCTVTKIVPVKVTDTLTFYDTVLVVDTFKVVITDTVQISDTVQIVKIDTIYKIDKILKKLLIDSTNELGNHKILYFERSIIKQIEISTDNINNDTVYIYFYGYLLGKDIIDSVKNVIKVNNWIDNIYYIGNKNYKITIYKQINWG